MADAGRRPGAARPGARSAAGRRQLAKYADLPAGPAAPALPQPPGHRRPARRPQGICGRPLGQANGVLTPKTSADPDSGWLLPRTPSRPAPPPSTSTKRSRDPGILRAEVRSSAIRGLALRVPAPVVARTQDLATAAQAAVQHHPHHQPCSGRPSAPNGMFRPRLKTAQQLRAEALRSSVSAPLRQCNVLSWRSPTASVTRTRISKSSSSLVACSENLPM